MTEQQKILSELVKLEILKVSFSMPYSKQSEVKKCTVRPISIKGKRVYQVESFTQKQAFHENIPTELLSSKMDEMLSRVFRQAQIFTPEYIYSLKISSKGKILHNRTKNTQKVLGAESNNRKKNYIIDIENMPPVFCELGICTPDGKIINSKYDKFRQICRFTEIIDDVVAKDSRECFNIVDFGCGKSYLTFVVHHYFTKILGKKVNIVGLDLKEEVINNCNDLCKKYGIENTEFLCMDVKDYKPKLRVDIVIALHACDVATDFALYNAYLWQADYIFSAPCCQHEMNAVINSKNFDVLCDYGLLKERFCALSTDALRAKLLTLCGYKADILEFVDAEISPKNLLIRAKRTTKNTYSDIKRLSLQIKTFDDEFCSPLTLERLIFSDFHRFTVNNCDFECVCAKASMLVKDALTIRHEVFGNEQGFELWSGRDEKDDDALFCNIYYGGKIAASARMISCQKQENSVLLGRIAVCEKYRGFGLGRVLVDSLVQKAKDNGVSSVFVNSRQSALGFYKRCGFEICGTAFDEGNECVTPVVKRI